jgi:DNA topoisomerase-1
MSLDDLDFESAVQLIADRRAKGPSTRATKKAPKKTATKKTSAKKTTTRKTVAKKKASPSKSGNPKSVEIRDED